MSKEYRGIDISSYQGKPDMKKVKKCGTQFVILRAHQRDGIDTSFEHNYSECVKNKIPVGIYKFSYAMNEEQSKAEADAVLKVLNGRELDYPVFIDMEFADQRKLPKDTLTSIIKVFCKKIKKAGYIPAIYCNADWYKNVLDTAKLDYPYWIAAYPANDTGVVQERLRPGFGIGWQYSSKGVVSGINGKVDMDLFYKDYSGKLKPFEESDKGVVEEVSQAKIIMDKAISYMGTKENPPGSNNVIFNTHYYGGPVNGSWYPWCCAFVWDIFRMCGLSHLFYNGQKTAYCPTVENWARQNGQIVNKAAAKYGDIILFDWGGDGVADHIGFVESYNPNTGVYTTIEGNTSDGNDSNGGIVMRRTRYPSSVRCIIRPKYTDATPSAPTDEKWTATGTATSTANNLYVRMSPSTNGVVLGELMKGNRFEVNGEKSGKWVKAKVANMGIGWIHSNYIKYDNTASNKPSKPAQDTVKNKQDKNERLFVGRVMATALNVRSWAGTGNPQIKSYPQLGHGNLVDVMNFTQKDEYGADWYYVRIAGKYFGFVKAEFIAKQ